MIGITDVDVVAVKEPEHPSRLGVLLEQELNAPSCLNHRARLEYLNRRV